MKLMPQELREQIPHLYSTEEQSDPLVHVKLFTPDADWSFFITEISIDDNVCFGLVVSPFVPNGELGYFTLEELKTVNGNLGLPIERDTWFKPTSLSNVKRQYCEN